MSRASDVQPDRTASPGARIVAVVGMVMLLLRVIAGLAALVLGGWLVYAVTTAEEAPGGLAAAGAVIALLGIWLIVRTNRGRG